jgi:chondroitin AC lyase
VASRGTRDFVGGVSDGAYGLAAMDFARGPLAARKAWLFLDREIVCLGTGITSSADDPVLTSVNQCLLRGPVTVSDGRQATPLDRGRRELGGLCWVHHDGVGYVFPEKAKVVVAAEKQEGNWHDIVMANRSQPVTEDVFSLWIDHGTRVSGGQYCYRIVPGVEPDSLEAQAKSHGVEILRNTPAQQAVWHPELKMAMAAFYEPGRMKSGDLEVSVDRPCLLLARMGPAALDLAVSNPESRPLKVSVEVNLHLEGDGCEWLGDRKVSRVTFELLTGEDAGKSVVRRLSAR